MSARRSMAVAVALLAWLPAPPAAAGPGPWLLVGGKLPSSPRRMAQLPERGAYGFLDQVVLRWAKVSTRRSLVLPGLGQTTTGRCKTTSEKASRVERISQGFCGTGKAGYRWRERTDLESSAVPLVARAWLYGVAGLQLVWRFSLGQVGQAGYASFRHGELRVRFGSPAARRRFVTDWTRYFGAAPTFAPVARARRRRSGLVPQTP